VRENRSVSGGGSSADNPYDDALVAGLYDALNAWGRADAYYLELVMSARLVLDLGCGTGQLLKRAAAEGHTGVLVGVDPAAAMLAEAARTPSPVTWLRADAQTMDVGRSFELVTMTGHAFQELPTDEAVLGALRNVRRHLEPGGRFAFETRNPEARAWVGWTPEASRRVVEAPTGESVEVLHAVERTIEPDLVELVTSFRLAGSPEPRLARGLLRFIDPDRLRSLLEEAGYRIDGWFGDWDRSPLTPSSPEVIVVATRPE
jgi:SAM-dependent methyltransferase